MMRLLVLSAMVLLSISVVGAIEHDWWNREPNYTLNYSKVPWVLRGVTPQLSPPNQEQYDLISVPEERPRLDPRTCPGEIAQCYQIRQHNFTGELSGGKNYSATSSYVLPERRVKTTLCIGDDVQCVERATNCFCPSKDLPKPPVFFGATPRCSDEQHLCRDTYATFTLCEGNLTFCREEHLVCGCGPYATCTGSTKNACLNDEDELILCDGVLADCLGQFDTCFCGSAMMVYQRNACDASRHSCTSDGRNVTCYGSFTDCALRNDVCECGTA